MSGNIRLVVALAIGIVVVFVSACDRKITRIEQLSTTESCFGCHSDNNTALVSAEAQYDHSLHASAENLNRNFAPCSGCHTSEGWIMRLETGSAPALVENPTAIHCFTCHAPHSNGDFSLRLTAAPPLQNGTSFNLGSANTCVDCHQSRRNVDTYVRMPTDTVVFTSRNWGPHHSVQGDMVIGSNGYEYAGFNYEITNHRTATSNGCLDCHFDHTRNYVVGGHSFNMSYDDDGSIIRNTAACATCHGNVSDFNVNGVQDSVDTLIGTLRGLLLAANLIDGTDHTVSGRTVAASDSAGAVWNFLMALEDQSRGVHNRKYIMGLLNSAIQFMNGTLSSPVIAEKREDDPGASP